MGCSAIMIAFRLVFGWHRHPVASNLKMAFATSSAFAASREDNCEEQPVNRLLKRAKQTLRRCKDSIIQPCPPQLHACEVCDRLECDNEKWQQCEHRLKVASEVIAAETQCPLKQYEDSSCETASEDDSSPR